MAKLFENSAFVCKLSQDDPECDYVNRMMEMSADFLRELDRSGQCYNSLHGVVPTYKLPIGYNYGNIDTTQKNKTSYEKKENVNGFHINSQNSSKSNSMTRMEIYEHDNETNSVHDKMIETVKGDLTLSEEDDDPEYEVTQIKRPNVDNINDNFQLLFDTLEACAKKIPILSSLNIFQKHYRPSRPNSVRHDIDTLKTEISDNVFSNNDTKTHYDENLKKFINLISESTYKTKLSSSFQTIYNFVNSQNNNKRKLIPETIEEIYVTPSKLQKLSPVPEPKKHEPLENFFCHFKEDVFELSINVFPKWSKDIRATMLSHSKNITNLPKIVTESVNEIKPKYHTEDSLPSNNVSKTDTKVILETSQITVNQSTTNIILTDNVDNPIGQPEAAAKQYFVNHSDYLNHNSNTKVAVVAGKINETQSNIQNKIDRNQSSQSLAYKGANNNDLVVQGLLAMRRMRTSFKNDFIARMRNLDNGKWLKEVNSLKEKANNCKGQLDYAPQIMVYIRKNLFYNYSLEVKSDYGTSHRTYLENAAMIKQSCSIITKIYNEHEKQIIDKNSVRLWNIKLVKHFTVIMCHRLSAILQYRAYRNVADDCRKIQETLIRAGIIDRNDRTNPSLTSPFSALSSSCSSPGHGSSTRTGSPGVPYPFSNAPPLNPVTATTTTVADVTLTGDMKVQLQRYIDQTNIINSSYTDWMLAEKHYVSFCNRSVRHEESWRDFEWQIVEKTSGILMSSIDESVPFVVKYLEGYINFMNEFMKRNL